MLTIQDFVHGRDFTGINPATGGDHNNLVDLAAPHADSASEGIGLVIWTIDTALNTPDVPDPTGLGAGKWKRYLWLRIPFQGIPLPPTLTPLLYGWNDAGLSIPTYLKWIQIVSDTASLQTQINNIVNQIGTIQSTAVNAQTIANQANTTAGIANTNSQNALTQVAAATNTANAAKTEADQAIAGVNTLTTDLNTLQQQVSTIVQTSIPTVTNIQRACVILSEIANAGNDLAAAVAGSNLRTINQKDYDPQNLITLNAGKMTFNLAGTYRIRATVPIVYIYPGSGHDSLTAQSYIKRDSDSGSFITSTSIWLQAPSANNVITGFMTLDGVITVTAAQVWRLDTHCSESGLGLLGQHAQDGVHFPPATHEVFTVIEIQQLQ